jgi:hypothetical protein
LRVHFRVVDPTVTSFPSCENVQLPLSAGGGGVVCGVRLVACVRLGVVVPDALGVETGGAVLDDGEALDDGELPPSEAFEITSLIR